MVQTLSMHCSSDPTQATIRALSSLTRRDADAVRATARAAARGHTVHEHDDYDGYLSLLVTPAHESRSSYMVAGRTGAVDIAELHGDDFTAIGTYSSIGAAMAALRPALEDPGRTVPRSELAAATSLVERHGADASLHAAMHADAQPGSRNWSSVLRTLDDLGAPS